MTTPRRRLMQEFAARFADVHAILHPNDAAGLLQIGNHCGYPAIAVPVGFVEQPTRVGFDSWIPPEQVGGDAVLHRVPFGVTLTGPLFDEAQLCAIALELIRNLDAPRAVAAKADAPDGDVIGLR